MIKVLHLANFVRIKVGGKEIPVASTVDVLGG
jgi:hypothetical protein